METVRRGLLLLPRQDLTSPFADVVEWRMRAHDGVRLWGLRGLNPFRPEPSSALVRAVDITELPQVNLDVLAEGSAEFVYQVPAGRRLEDRVLDLLRVIQLALGTSGLEPDGIRLDLDSEQAAARESDDVMIVEKLLAQGILSR